MARLFTDGAETGNTDGLTAWSSAHPVAMESTTKRSGSYSYRFDRADPFYGWGWMYRSFAAKSEVYFRTAWRTGFTGDGSHYELLSFGQDGSSTYSIRFDTTNNVLYAQINSATVASGTMPIVLDNWILLEVHINIADSNGSFQLKVDGILDIDYSGDTKPGTATTINRFYMGIHSYATATNNFVFFDDIAINDTTGANDNSWCGDGNIVMLIPNSAGDVTQLTSSTGANYECVNDIPPNGDTDYVYSTVLDNYDLYNLSTITFPADATFLRIIPTVYAKNKIASGGKISLGIKTNDTEYWSDDITLSIGYVKRESAEYLLNPNTSSAWTENDLINLQLGVKVR